MDVLDGSAGKNYAVIRLIRGFLDFAFLKNFLNALPVLRMNPVKVEFGARRILTRFDVEYSIDFRRDRDCPRCNVMSPATRMAYSLSLKQTFFTAAQIFLHELAFGDVRNRSDQLRAARFALRGTPHDS